MSNKTTEVTKEMIPGESMMKACQGTFKAGSTVVAVVHYYPYGSDVTARKPYLTIFGDQRAKDASGVKDFQSALTQAKAILPHMTNVYESGEGEDADHTSIHSTRRENSITAPTHVHYSLKGASEADQKAALKSFLKALGYDNGTAVDDFVDWIFED